MYVYIYTYTGCVHIYLYMQLLMDHCSIVCICVNSPIKDSYHGHISTGDLRVMKDKKLGKRFSKGPKYHEPKKIDFDQRRGILQMVLKIVLQYEVKNMEPQMMFY